MHLGFVGLLLWGAFLSLASSFRVWKRVFSSLWSSFNMVGCVAWHIKTPISSLLRLYWVFFRVWTLSRAWILRLRRTWGRPLRRYWNRIFSWGRRSRLFSLTVLYLFLVSTFWQRGWSWRGSQIWHPTLGSRSRIFILTLFFLRSISGLVAAIFPVLLTFAVHFSISNFFLFSILRVKSFVCLPWLAWFFAGYLSFSNFNIVRWPFSVVMINIEAHLVTRPFSIDVNFSVLIVISTRLTVLTPGLTTAGLGLTAITGPAFDGSRYHSFCLFIFFGWRLPLHWRCLLRFISGFFSLFPRFHTIFCTCSQHHRGPSKDVCLPLHVLLRRFLKFNLGLGDELCASASAALGNDLLDFSDGFKEPIKWFFQIRLSGLFFFLDFGMATHAIRALSFVKKAVHISQEGSDFLIWISSDCAFCLLLRFVFFYLFSAHSSSPTWVWIFL